MNNQFQNIYELVQHTPILHFQHDQHGAGIRVTELKPKLDKWLIQKQKSTLNEAWWIQEQEGNALDYSVKIIPNGKKNQNIQKGNNPLVLTDIDDGRNNTLKFVYYDEGLTLTITSLHYGLLNLIDEQIANFLGHTNFGNRQTKGFGNFYLRPGCKAHKSIEDVLKRGTPYLEFKTNASKLNRHIKKNFQVIDYYWNRLKPGINHEYREGNEDDDFERSFFVKFINNDKYGFSWSKKWLKLHFFSDDNEHSPNDFNARFARAILGMPNNYFFKKTSINPEIEHDNYGVSVEVNKDTTITITREEGNDIQRIPSPITFNPFNMGDGKWKVYILVNPKFDQEDLLDKQFLFKAPNNVPSTSVKLPSKIIDLDNLLSEFHKKELEYNFEPKSYQGYPIVDSEVKIEETGSS